MHVTELFLITTTLSTIHLYVSIQLIYRNKSFVYGLSGSIAILKSYNMAKSVSELIANKQNLDSYKNIYLLTY